MAQKKSKRKTENILNGVIGLFCEEPAQQGETAASPAPTSLLAATTFRACKGN